MAKSRSQPTNLPGARSLMDPLGIVKNNFVVRVHQVDNLNTFFPARNSVDLTRVFTFFLNYKDNCEIRWLYFAQM